MLSIAVVDDEKVFSDRLSGFIHRYSEERGLKTHRCVYLCVYLKKYSDVIKVSTDDRLYIEASGHTLRNVTAFPGRAAVWQVYGSIVHSCPGI